MSANLMQPLFPGSGVMVWHGLLVLGALLVIFFAVLTLYLLRRRRLNNVDRPQTRPVPSAAEEPLTANPSLAKPVNNDVPAVALMQGVGQRAQQQDAFAVSPLEKAPSQGLLAVVCDGMGGMAEGARFASMAVEYILQNFPFAQPTRFTEWPLALTNLNHTLRKSVGEVGGTTLVMAYTWGGKLWFWSIGDSDIFLLRGGKLYAVNARHEYGNRLLLGAMKGQNTLATALTDPQRASLTEYLGNRSVAADFSRRPLTLQKGDKLLLCSDGVSDTLPIEELRQLLLADVQTALAAMECRIVERAANGQDNYTAIAIDFDALAAQV